MIMLNNIFISTADFCPYYTNQQIGNFEYSIFTVDKLQFGQKTQFQFEFVALGQNFFIS